MRYLVSHLPTWVDRIRGRLDLSTLSYEFVATIVDKNQVQLAPRHLSILVITNYGLLFSIEMYYKLSRYMQVSAKRRIKEGRLLKSLKVHGNG